VFRDSDFDDELDLYRNVNRLIRILEATEHSPALQMEDIYLFLVKELVAARIVLQPDFDLAQAWVQDLRASGYKWPARRTRMKSPYLPLLSDSRIFDGRKSSISTELQSKIFWTSDLHDGTRLDFTTQLMQLGHQVRNMGHKGFNSPYPEFIREMMVPSRPLSDVLMRFTGMTSLTDAAAREFFEHYKNDADMLATDAFMCHFPASFCEIYLPFNRTIIVSASHRMFLARCSSAETKLLIQHLRAMAVHPRRHFIFGSNRYDAEYISHYTGIRVNVLPASSYGYQLAAYAATRQEILVGPLQLTESGWIKDMDAVSQGRWIFKTAKQVYSRFSTQVGFNNILAPFSILNFCHRILRITGPSS
jgi:hypothetical protein